MALTAILAALFGCGDKGGGPYQRRDDGWYFKDEALNVPAGETVTPLQGDFATAGDRVFYRAAPIERADARTFEVLSDHHAKDRAAVYYADTHREGQEYFLVKHTRVRRIEGADPASFRYLDHDYARDASNAYFEGERFPVADAATFEPLGYGHARDRVRGYYQQRPIEGSHGASFAALDDHYAKDAQHVFYSDVDLRSRPVATRSVTLAGAHAASFTALDDGYAADSARAWFKGRPLKDAVPTLEVLAAGYAKTAARVYYFGDPVPDADAPSFKADAMTGAPGTDASDARGPFYEGKRVTR
jgi:hypothetical protein